jgi:hypothetical protein
MSATDETYHDKHARLPGKAESLETLKALARLLARQAAAEVFDKNQSAASIQ